MKHRFLLSVLALGHVVRCSGTGCYNLVLGLYYGEFVGKDLAYSLRKYNLGGLYSSFDIST